MQVSNEKELAEAIENGENSIEIVGDFSKKIVKIKATGDVAWGIAIAAIAAEKIQDSVNNAVDKATNKALGY
ncbi:hypothetical protein [Helicobacter ailurogastricus]|uniref:hypothetical protein n=1 Tax=Helicobacter ailurogastricus TaxID=1578720 RepID=UPI0022C31475|nr:hypothetical protein [Helicobacter ailurogastricus]GLH57292.1 hypothetical protein NHP214376_00780 [Helicobacter ailurogastricus]GMB92275.1 hypothetical protein NHP190009_14690 [Helicobacter ailurogastricus]